MEKLIEAIANPDNAAMADRVVWFATTILFGSGFLFLLYNLIRQFIKKTEVRFEAIEQENTTTVEILSELKEMVILLKQMVEVNTKDIDFLRTERKRTR